VTLSRPPEVEGEHDFYALVEAFRLDRTQRSLRVKGYVSENTTQCYQRNLTSFEAYLRGRQLSTDPWQIGRAQIEGHLGELAGSGRSAATINNHLASIRSFFFFLRKKFGLKNPARHIERSIEPTIPRAVTPTAEQTRLLLDYLRKDKKAQKRDYFLFDLMIRTGARVGEVCALDLDSIERTADTLRIVLLGKGNKERELCIQLDSKPNQAFANRFRLYLRGRRKWKQVRPGHETALFLTNGGRRLGSRDVQNAFAYYRRKLGFNERLTPHSLRHYFATRLLSGGASLNDVSYLLGHANAWVTASIYIHPQRDQANQRLSQAF